MRPYLLAGNWKMNNNVEESIALAKTLCAVKVPSGREVMIAPSYIALSEVSKVVKGTSVKLGAQNFYCEDKGAFTGEISASMLKSVGVEYIILGHSERRAIFGETDDLINKKVKKAIAEGFKAVLCVGETLQEREAGKANEVTGSQTEKGLAGVAESDLEKVVIAYEPVWAIGTGKTASPEDADDMHKYIRNLIKSQYSAAAAEKIVILYGGSVNDANVDSLMAKENIDGGLVGGASLKADSFTRIIQFN